MTYQKSRFESCWGVPEKIWPISERLTRDEAGASTDVTIRKLAETVADMVGYRGTFTWNRECPDGTPRKLLDVSRLTALGWTAQTPLKEGLARAYDWFVANAAEAA